VRWPLSRHSFRRLRGSCPPRRHRTRRPPSRCPNFPSSTENNHVVLDKDNTFYVEQNPDKKFLRILLATEVCLREGPLEVFLCKKGTKEHEAILRVDLDAKLIHAALEARGPSPAPRRSFVNPKTNEQEFKPATGTKVKVLVHYKKDGKLHTHPARSGSGTARRSRPCPRTGCLPGASC